jgi:rhamnosyltransferase
MSLHGEKVLAVIVTYCPTEEIQVSVRLLQQQVAHVLIVDNSPDPRFGQLLQGLQKDLQFDLIVNGFNLGIAGALNRGVQYAQKNGFDWVLTLDDDSIVPPDYIQTLLKTYNESPEKDKIAILAPAHFDKKTGYQSRDYRGIKGPYVSKDIVMTSGNLIPIWVFDKIGYYDEDLFIEYVDHDFCLRVKKAGYKTVLVATAVMGHSLGSIRKHSLIGGIFFFSHNYLPVRRYYRARNRLVLYRRYFGAWILQDQEFAIKDMVKILLVEDMKWQKIKATLLGTIDGLLGRMGSFDGATYKTPKASKYFVEFREEIVPLLPEKVGRALDLGCGSGETSGHLKKIGKFQWVCGVEGSPDAAILARQKLDEVLEGDIEKIGYPFPDESFDLILTLDILEHLVDPWSTLQELYRLLKPGGVIIASIPNVRHYSVVFPLVFLGDWRYTQEGLLDSTHIRFFTKSTAAKLFQQQNMELEMWDHTGAKRGLGALLNSITFGLFKEFFIFQNLYRFRKPFKKD